MNKKRIIYIILISLFVVILAAPSVQKEFKLFNVKKLTGVTYKTKKPKLTFDNYKNGTYQTQVEKYLSENFGFREICIRFQNQYLWDFYRKSYSEEISVGKEDWLFMTYGVRDYYGKEMYKWQDNNAEAIKKYDREVSIMNKLRGVLKTFDIDFLVFMAPEKSFLYPQFLPDDVKDTLTINAREYYSARFDSIGFPYIEMTKWFQQMNDTASHPLIPQCGTHWNFSSVYAADSLFRFMAKMKNTSFPQIKIGGRCELDKEATNALRDIEVVINLMRPIDISKYEYPEYEVTVETDSLDKKYNALFVGNSYFWGIRNHLPVFEIFNDVKYWYYNVTAFEGKKLDRGKPVKDTDRLQEILDQDYIVWFTCGGMMYSTSYGFAEDALIQLCVSDSLWKAETKRCMDSLNISKDAAEDMLKGHPELIKGLDVEGVPTIRNERGIAIAKTKNVIEADTTWMAALKSQSLAMSKPIDTVIQEEATNFIDNKPLYKNSAVVNDSIIEQYEINRYIEMWKRTPAAMENLKKKAKDRNQTLEATMIQDAKWVIKQEKLKKNK